MAFSFKANVEEFAKSAEVRVGSSELLPNGFYEVELIDVKQKESKSAAHNGVPLYELTLKLTDTNSVGAGQRLWGNIMLIERFNNAKKTPNFTLNQFVKALGLIDEEGNVSIPDPEDLLDMDAVFGVKVELKPEETYVDKGETKTRSRRNEVNGYVPLSELEEILKGQKLDAVAPKVTAESTAGTADSGIFFN